MRLTQRACEVVDLLAQPCLLAGRLRGPVAMLKTLAAGGEELLALLADRRLRHPVATRGLGLRAFALKDRQDDLQLDVDGVLRRTSHDFSSRSVGSRTARARGCSPSQLRSPYGLRCAVCVSTRGKPPGLN